MFSLNKTLIALRDAIKSSKLSDRSTITFQQDQKFYSFICLSCSTRYCFTFSIKTPTKKILKLP